MGKQKGKAKGGGGASFKKSQFNKGELNELHRIGQDAGFQGLNRSEPLRDWCSRADCELASAMSYLTTEKSAIETMTTGGCVWWALQIVCAPNPPSMPDLNAQIDPTLKELQEEDESWQRSDTGVENVGWSIPVVVRTLAVKYGADNFTWQQVHINEIRKANAGKFFVWGVLNRNYCPIFKGWINKPGESDNEWLHAIAVDATGATSDNGQVLCQNMKHLTKKQQQHLSVADLLGLCGNMPYFTDFREVYRFEALSKSTTTIFDCETATKCKKKGKKKAK
jgi:hypothetical protein